jgi:hypothetical protein
MSNLVEYAEKELDRAGLGDPDSDYGGMLKDAVLDIVRVFSEQGHSGFSAGMTTSLVEKLLRYEPLTPLTGEDDEWNEVGVGVWQNKRSFSVFKENGVAYDSGAVVVRDPHGSTWQARSRDPITFPYVPTHRVIDIDAHGRTKDRSESQYDVSGFCYDDGCRCWEGGEKLLLDGDGHLTDKEKRQGLDGK